MIVNFEGAYSSLGNVKFLKDFGNFFNSENSRLSIGYLVVMLELIEGKMLNYFKEVLNPYLKIKNKNV